MNISFGVISFGIFILIVGLIFYLISKQARENYSQYNPIIQTLKDEILTCFPELIHLQVYEGNKSYTINKEKIYLCIRDKYNNYYNKNVLMYVLLHEIAHTLCTDVGHTPQFKEIFEILLQRAKEANIYSHVEIPKDYCNFV
jgi:predicted metal-dependent hydrolase